ncbi:hypothetical protein, unlikely [Trypanosoma brucei gambiense DAL972]|uniref:Uncharacterized protein n=1 Tax=Trypanosoma brucei gambiense (strain MHOM/CI/86/DAL972) TaxID=679716 RepID=C9ZTS2_TRYB9|nr:hypothetical protein, unlikely [Trypanosoma brucei gambiense DAL972]CBH12808.1 hypothetical protein, unlikely [Trypanosoma brucei gambiense DAL972]|eukprot:XP_011775087.1 hypothetical protein, unlikely [Trypanosoma brucei gambiense DAL972]
MPKGKTLRMCEPQAIPAATKCSFGQIQRKDGAPIKQFGRHPPTTKIGSDIDHWCAHKCPFPEKVQGECARQKEEVSRIEKGGSKEIRLPGLERWPCGVTHLLWRRNDNLRKYGKI